MEFGDASDEEAPSAPPRNKGSNKKFEDADCFNAPRDGERWLIVKRIDHRHHQKIWRGMLHSLPVMEEGGTHMHHRRI